MKKANKLCTLSLLCILSLCGCNGGGSNSTSTSTSDSTSTGGTSTSSQSSTSEVEELPKDLTDEFIYNRVFSDFYEKYSEALEMVDNDNERYIADAQAEARLLDSGAFLPMNSNGGRYGLSRVAYRSTPYCLYGLDSDKIKTSVVTKEFITKEEREELMKKWDEAANDVTGETKYDPAAYLESKGHTFDNVIKTSFSTIPQTLDILSTSRSEDSSYICNTLDGLVEHDSLGNIIPAIAQTWDISDDGKTYTFHLRDDVNWYTANGNVYAKLTAKDFVDGFHHMCDAKGGLEYLVEGLIEGAMEYVEQMTTDFSKVGIKALDDTTLQIKLCEKKNNFISMLTYSIFMPMNARFFESKGGCFGVDEFTERSVDSSVYTYGRNNDIGNILYSGAYKFTSLTDKSKIELVKNPGYYNLDSVRLDRISYIYNDGSDATTAYASAVKGDYTSISLSEEIIDLAKQDGNFDKYAFISNTDATCYFAGWNLHRQSFISVNNDTASKSSKKADAIEKFQKAILNKNFRLALNHAIDKEKYNAASVGTDIAKNNLRNIYTHTELVKLSEDTTVDGHTFAENTTYGELVQYYLNQLYGVTNDADCEIQVADGQDGWFKPELAKSYMDKAVAELGNDFFSTPIEIDYIIYGANTTMKNQANQVKASLETTLQGKVKVNLLAPSNMNTYLYCGYYTDLGEQANYDVYTGSGWGPDYGDPQTFLDTFLPDGAGYMTKVVGLY